ncbi:MAG: hypothetical protein HYR51_16005 [Candidatus Rokubacteria bacterium]|nr:hypothetical protein [Candidatus Rokubacteria bacterium]
MGRLRFFLILLLSVALDFSSPVMPEGMESFEEFEEQSLRARARRVVRPARDAAAVPVARSTPQVEARAATAVRRAPARRPVIDAGVRKIPSAVADPAGPPEDH